MFPPILRLLANDPPLSARRRACAAPRARWVALRVVEAGETAVRILLRFDRNCNAGGCQLGRHRGELAQESWASQDFQKCDAFDGAHPCVLNVNGCQPRAHGNGEAGHRVDSDNECI